MGYVAFRIPTLGSITLRPPQRSAGIWQRAGTGIVVLAWVGIEPTIKRLVTAPRLENANQVLSKYCGV
jgi:hypothetical protein